MAKTKKEPKPKLKELALLPEKMSAANKDRLLCKTECGRECQPHNVWVPHGYTNKLLFVGVMPEEEEGSEYQKLLFSLFRQAGYSLEDAAMYWSVRCPGDVPSMREVRSCRPFLLRAIEVLQPKIIMAGGPVALKSLTNDGGNENVTEQRGYRLSIPGAGAAVTRDVWATYDPRGILEGGTHMMTLILEDLRRPFFKPLPEPNDFPLMIWQDGVAIDTEFAPDKSLLTLSLADPMSAVAKETTDPEYKTWLQEFLHREGKPKALVGHAIDNEIDQLVKLGIAHEEWVRGDKVVDTLLLTRMVDENRGKGNYGVESLIMSKYAVEPWKPATQAISKSDATLWPVDLRVERCRKDAWASAMLCMDMIGKVPPRLRQFTVQTAMAIHRIWLAGAAVDMKAFNALGVEWEGERGRTHDLLNRVAAQHGITEFSPTKDDQLREILYGKLGLPVIRKTAKEGLPSVNKLTLKQLKGKDGSGFIENLMTFNRVDKLLSTWYGKDEDEETERIPLAKRIVAVPVDGSESGSVGLIRFRINPLAARTGRRTSEAPNSQNWPPVVRSIIRSRYPGGCIADNDFKSLEPLLMGICAKEPKLVEYFGPGGPGYIGVAKDLFKMEVKKGTVEYRTVKEVVLGTQYGMGAFKLAHKLWDEMDIHLSADWKAHKKLAEGIRRKYLDQFPGIERFMWDAEQELLNTSRIVTLTGRERHFVLTDGRETPGFGHLRNEAINVKIQGLAADVTACALLDLESMICGECGIALVEYHQQLMEGLPYRRNIPVIINEVHDDLVLDLPTKTWGERVKVTMESMPTLRQLVPELKDVRFRIDQHVAERWGLGKE